MNMVYKFINDCKMYSRFVFGLKGFLKGKITIAESGQIIKKRMEQRGDNFLKLLKKGVFGYRNSPYLQLLKLSNCKYEDVEKMVLKNGIEETLRILKDDGVYFTVGEFKGKKRIVRKGKEFIFKESDFDNPYTASCYESFSSGSRGAGTRVMVDFEYNSELAVYKGIAMDNWNLSNVPHVLFLSVFPYGAGMDNMLKYSKFGIYPVKWISLLDERNLVTLRSKLGVAYIFFISKMLGAKFPIPEFINLKDIPWLVELIAKMLQEHKGCCITTHVSFAVRICLAAKEKGISLEGVKFWVAGEPLTAIKNKQIESVGAKCILKYAFIEGGEIGSLCLKPSKFDDIHLFKDRVALVTYPEKVLDSQVNAFLFTIFLPSSPKILLNVGNGDYGIIETRNCACPYDDFGWDTHIYSIKSFEKLTGEGMTFYGDRLISLVEEILPRKFGGTSLDYQLVEEEDEKGLTHLVVMVSPKIKDLEEDNLIKMVVEQLSKGGDSQRVMIKVWLQAGTIRIKRDFPILTRTGKVHPLYVSPKGRTDEKKLE